MPNIFYIRPIDAIHMSVSKNEIVHIYDHEENTYLFALAKEFNSYGQDNGDLITEFWGKLYETDFWRVHVHYKSKSK